MVRTREAMIDSMQAMRIAKKPLLAGGNLIVADFLEYGNLKIYEQTGESALQAQQLFTGIDCWPGAAMVAKTVIFWSERKDNSIAIESIFCEYGHEELAKAMIRHVISFAEFYGIREITISEGEREKWFLYAGGILADFNRNQDGCYEYHVM